VALFDRLLDASRSVEQIQSLAQLLCLWYAANALFDRLLNSSDFAW
jgi:hypothetical protein